MKKQQTVNENMSPEEYEAYVKQVTPTFSLGLNMVKAFITGGIICTIGQALMELFLSYELEKKDASAATLLVIIFTTAILTGLNLFSKIVSVIILVPRAKHISDEKIDCISVGNPG